MALHHYGFVGPDGCLSELGPAWIYNGHRGRTRTRPRRSNEGGVLQGAYRAAPDPIWIAVCDPIEYPYPMMINSLWLR